MASENTINTHEDLQSLIWSELEKAILNRNHGWRTPVLATIDSMEIPDARTVVLREIDPINQALTIYTDNRSPKVTQLSDHPDVALVFWCSTINCQLRIQAYARLCNNPEKINQVWQQVRLTASASDYLSLQAPSSPLHHEGLLSDSQHSLCIVELHIKSMDWLCLNPHGHKRAKLEKNQLTWLTP